eukprot:TRINITY_DN4537_c0_g1_i1.p1 TRINITY_DN4537_c0_g1~~TRINITY_DN4537_c0_g1_i1.p1  ORF type:complete len:435 (-),score=29.38 TRINITY_DN4537_c0_g1_i1:325-1629(-)
MKSRSLRSLSSLSTINSRSLSSDSTPCTDIELLAEPFPPAELASPATQISPAAEMAVSVHHFQKLDASDAETSYGSHDKPAMRPASQCRPRTWITAASCTAFTLLLVVIVANRPHPPQPSTHGLGVKCADCAEVYYAAAACLLGGGQLTETLYAEADLYSKLMPGSGSLRELERLFGSREFQEATRCPRWMQWSARRNRCELPHGVVGTRCPHRDANVSFVDGNRQVCTANLYRRRSSTWSGGKCTCPDGSVYLVSDNNDACSSVRCYGGEAGHCFQSGAGRSGYAGYEVTCFPDINTSAKQLGRAHPLRDAACWQRQRPLFVHPEFQATTRRHDSVAEQARESLRGLLSGAFAASACEGCKNLQPRSFRYGPFDAFYVAFHATHAGDLCRASFGAGSTDGKRPRKSADSPRPVDRRFDGQLLSVSAALNLSSA